MTLVKMDTTRIDTRLVTPPESPEATFRHRRESCEGRTKAAPASIYLPVRSRGDLAAERTSDATIKFRAHPRCLVRILAWETRPLSPPRNLRFDAREDDILLLIDVLIDLVRARAYPPKSN